MESGIQNGKIMFRVIETFSGIGAQAKALERMNIEFEIVNTCDWDIGAIVAYCQIHNGNIPIDKYKDVSEAEINEFLSEKTLSSDGKKPMNTRTYKNLSAEAKRLIYTAIRETKNYVSITDVKGTDIDNNIDLLTYSFPCQDLSMCGYWHGNKSGISKDAHNRSGMLWEIERILKEMHSSNIRLPRFLVMENVTNILSSTHKKDFDDWKNTLNNLGYFNHIYRLNAKNFGVPQKRERAYMISILIDDDYLKYMQLIRFFDENNLEREEVSKKYSNRLFKLKDVLKLDYSNEKYKKEADLNCY